ncbi:hypothetical protein [Marinisporobacter balticus]|uniref:Sporulation protein YjcZ n=1 Tax=Marinisporobacter balticus TaxID=2018667 RepID=A0A4R2KLS2_9FIRM|nr:hypothetical protein [Marinisporobacter balticus]TCO74633.1 hypothetical protein EV214_112114 [Marinisporobacter balticus]
MADGAYGGLFNSGSELLFFFLLLVVLFCNCYGGFGGFFGGY